MRNSITYSTAAILMLVCVCETAFALEERTERGAIRTNPSLLFVQSHTDTILKISGESSLSGRQDITVTVTFPDSRTDVLEITSADDGSFHTLYTFNADSQTGTYYLSGSSGQGTLGQVSFQIVKRNDESVLQDVPSGVRYTFDKIAAANNRTILSGYHIPVPETAITVETDSESYTKGDKVIVSGTIHTVDMNLYDEIPISIQVYTVDNRVFIGQVSASSNGTFSMQINTDGKTWSENIPHTVKAVYDGTDAEAVFLIASRIHATSSITMEVFGDVVDFAAPEYQERDPEIMFTDNDGTVIHRYGEDADIGRLFDSFGMKINSSCIVFENGRSFCKNSQHDLEFQINRKKINSVHDYIPQNNDSIIITYETVYQPPQNVSSPVPEAAQLPKNASSPAPEAIRLLQNSSVSTEAIQLPKRNATVQPVSPSPGSTNPNTYPAPPPPPSRTSAEAGYLLLAIILTIIVVSAVVVIRHRSRTGSGKKRTNQQKNPPRGGTPNASKGNNVQEASTMFYYECPKCYNPNISNNPDGSVQCNKCGFSG